QPQADGDAVVQIVSGQDAGAVTERAPAQTRLLEPVDERCRAENRARVKDSRDGAADAERGEVLQPLPGAALRRGRARDRFDLFDPLYRTPAARFPSPLFPRVLQSQAPLLACRAIHIHESLTARHFSSPPTL